MGHLSALFLILILNGCATFTKEQCQTFDWNERGYRSAIGGRTQVQAQAYYQNKCTEEHGVDYDRKQLEAGYKKGLEEFCSPENALKFGASGSNYQGTCPKEKEKAFVSNFRAGTNIYLQNRVEELETEKQQLQQQIDDLSSRISNLESELSSRPVSCF